MMTDVELKRLKREQLLEMLIASEKKNVELQEVYDQEIKKTENLQNQLDSRKLDLDEAGNLAEASLKIEGVFESAQKAAEVYLENIRALSERQEMICKTRELENRAEIERALRSARIEAETMTSKAKAEAEDMTSKAKAEAETMTSKAKAEAETMTSKAKAEAESFTKQAQEKADFFIRQAKTEYETMTAKARIEAEELKKQAQHEADQYWSEVSEKLEKFYEAHAGLKELVHKFSD